MQNRPLIQNPFRPGAGQKPVYLAGRTSEHDEFRGMLLQNPIAQNAIITGLRGVGKTVLLDELKPIAQSQGWLWAGNDLSESISLTEERLARRIVVDLSTLLSPMIVKQERKPGVGFGKSDSTEHHPLEFADLWNLYEHTAGLTIDKLKAVLIYAWSLLEHTNIPGIVFAYDEAQNLADYAHANEYPLSLLIDVFSALQRSTSCRYLLVLTGLPTLYAKLNEARTYSERMFHIMHLQRLSDDEARQAITKPIEITHSPLAFSQSTIDTIIAMSGGYPYFIQFISKEVFDAWIGKIQQGEAASVPTDELLEKLDQDFFAARWARATDRQQDFMKVIATLDSSEDEFAVQEIVVASKKLLKKAFSPSHAQQILTGLADKGLVFRSRRGGYSFAVPLLSRFIKRQDWDGNSLKDENL
jgi:hypothetical protein